MHLLLFILIFFKAGINNIYYFLDLESKTEKRKHALQPTSDYFVLCYAVVLHTILYVAEYFTYSILVQVDIIIGKNHRI